MFQKITRKKLSRFLEKYATDKPVLDIGSGGSLYGNFFPNRLTLDIDPERNPEILADAHNLPFRDEEFEIILCTEVLEHTRNPQIVINEMYRVLKRGGTVVLSTRFVYPIHDAPNDYWRFTSFGLKRLFKNWNIIELVAETRNFSSIGVLLQRLCFQSNLRFNVPIKFLLLSMAWFFDKLNFLTLEEYGDIKKSRKEENILTS